jgi:hypothetical protein
MWKIRLCAVNIKIDLKEVGWKGVVWIATGGGALVSAVINLQVPYYAGKFMNS